MVDEIIAKQVMSQIKEALSSDNITGPATAAANLNMSVAVTFMIANVGLSKETLTPDEVTKGIYQKVSDMNKLVKFAGLNKVDITDHDKATQEVSTALLALANLKPEQYKKGLSAVMETEPGQIFKTLPYVETETRGGLSNTVSMFSQSVGILPNEHGAKLNIGNFETLVDKVSLKDLTNEAKTGLPGELVRKEKQ